MFYLIRIMNLFSKRQKASQSSISSAQLTFSLLASSSLNIAEPPPRDDPSPHVECPGGCAVVEDARAGVVALRQIGPRHAAVAAEARVALEERDVNQAMNGIKCDNRLPDMTFC